MTRFRGSGDRGAVTALELVLLTPLALVLAVFVVYCGRSGRASHQVWELASGAARAASIERSPDAAVAAAASIVASSTTRELSCAMPSVSFGGDGAVESVTVRVRCSISLSGLSMVPVGGTRTYTAAATEPIDRFRSPG